MTNLEEKAVKVISFCFYLIFLLTPLVFTPCTFLPWRIIPCTFELFEFNKMMFVYAITTVITGSWLIHTVATKKFTLRRTPFDIPILLFFLSQTLSTLFSIEPHTSLIGYYSRFHGGLFSTISYLILFYAFVTFGPKAHRTLADMGQGQRAKTRELRAKYSLPYALSPMLRNCILLLLTSASVVSAYGIAQHFGIDARFWVQDVQRRVFSSLGQPNWLAAFLVMVLPLTWAQATSEIIYQKSYRTNMIYDFLFMIFFLSLLYTKSRSGMLGFALAYTLFWGLTWLKRKTSFPWKQWLVFTFSILVLSFYDGLSWIPTIDNLSSKLTQKEPLALATPKPTPPPLVETGGSDSGAIRKIVWQGAIDVWRHYPILGSGVETFAYSYYNFRPVSHNSVSEWDFLYNKAHNEYLNLLATTGIVGLGAYFLLQAWFAIYSLKHIFSKKTLDAERLPRDEVIRGSVLAALISGYAGVSVSNFLGFSTVTVGFLSFIWMALAVVITNNSYKLKVYPVAQAYGTKSYNLAPSIKTVLLLIVLIATSYLLLAIGKWWYADTRFALGKQYEDAALPNEAYPLLNQAVALMPQEPTFRAELSKATADLAYVFNLQGATESAATMAQISLAHSDIVQRLNPVHLNLIKARIRVLLTLHQFNPELLGSARATLDRGIKLAPTDPKLYYNLALLELKAQNSASAEAALVKTLELKPDYEAARFAFGTFLEDQQKYAEAAREFQFILDRINPENSLARDHLNSIATQSALRK